MDRLKTIAALSLLFFIPGAANADRNSYSFSERGGRFGHQGFNPQVNHGWYKQQDRCSTNTTFPYSSSSSYSPYGDNRSQFDRLIYRGIRSGELSRAEVRELRDRQQDIRQEAIRYWSDGKLEIK